MKKKLLAIALLSVGAMMGQISLGIRIGPPPQPRIMRVRPNSPGAGYTWIDGYWYANNGRYAWHNGYWTRPPYQGAAWMNSRYEGGQFYQGYWSGNNRDYRHDHRWDKDKRNRDYDRNDDNNGRGRGRR